MKFIVVFALIAATANAEVARDENQDRFLSSIIGAILDQFKPVVVGPAIVDVPEPVIVAEPIIVPEPIMIAEPIIVEEPIIPTPVIVVENEPIDVSPVIVAPAPEPEVVTQPEAAPIPLPIPFNNSPLVQIIVNVKQGQSGTVAGSPVVVEGLPVPTPVAVEEGNFQPINPTPVMVAEPQPEPVLVGQPILPSPVITLPGTLN